jgi:hypothetical protein
VKLVLADIRQQGDYSASQLRRHRFVRAVVILSGAAVPVLASVSAVPRYVLGLVGAIAVVAEGFGQLFQFLQSAITAMSTANALEREVNLLSVAAGPYAGPRDQAFARFAVTVEEIRKAGDQAFREVWHRRTAADDGRPDEQQS